MAHTLQNVPNHHEGDTARLDITVRVNGEIQPIDGGSAEWFLIEDEESIDGPITEQDADLVKTGSDGGTGEEIDFTDPVNGELTVNIDEGDTTGLVDWAAVAGTMAEYDHRLRVNDSENRRTTQFTGTFEIHK